MTTLEKLEELVYHGFDELRTSQKELQTLQKVTERGLQRLREDVVGLTKSLGFFAESMVHPSAVRLFSDRGIPLTGVSTRLKEHLNGETMEVDVLGTGQDDVVVIEAKLRLEQGNVKDFLKQLSRFFDFFPHFRGRRLYGAVAGASIDQGVDRFAYKQGLFVLAQTGDNMKILNDVKFVPHLFSEPTKSKARARRLH